MFGYVVANNEIMSDEQKEKYKSYYCGLCSAIKERHGQLARLTLTYDMTFLIIVLNSLYEPSCVSGNERCFLHPCKKHCYKLTEISDYAADMNVALAYLKLQDDWNDEKKFSSLVFSKFLKRKYKRIAKLYPRQCAVIEKSLKELSEFEEKGDCDPDYGAKLFGDIMAEVFVMKEDFWSNSLRSMGFNLGKFIYIMDAFMDLEDDAKKGLFNPLNDLVSKGYDENYFIQILTILLGDCTIELERLPLVEDIDIIRNIICSGVWIRFVLEQEKKLKREGESTND